MTGDANKLGDSSESQPWDHSSHERFTEYYASASQSVQTVQRFSALMHKMLLLVPDGAAKQCLEVADIGCGPGAQAAIWASAGHSVHAIDINAPLIDIAKRRTAEQHQKIEFLVGSATELPWPDKSMDLCLLPELLEHVGEWEKCLDEAARILRPGGILYLSTSNRLCPKQQEFSLPLYSWYPARLKRHYERLSVTTRPELVNYASYPAINWFSFYELRAEVETRGMRALDRFEFNARTSAGGFRKLLLNTICNLAPLRFLGQVVTPYTLLVAIKS